MASGKEIIKFLDLLDREYGECSFVLVPSDSIVDFPWLRKYAWVSASYIHDSDGIAPAHPKEMPVTGDRLFVVARNLSLGKTEILFECTSRKGKIRLDYAETDGVFRKRLLAVPGGAPVDDVTPLTILEVDSTSDLLNISSSLTTGEEARSKPLVFRF